MKNIPKKLFYLLLIATFILPFQRALAGWDGYTINSFPADIQPTGSLVMSYDSNTLYGVTEMGPDPFSTNSGTIYSVDTNGNNYTDIHDFPGDLNYGGNHPLGGLTIDT